jgi:hypothetical protein
MSYGDNGDMSFEEFSKFIWDNKSKLTPELNNDKDKILLYIDDKGYRPNAVFESLFQVAALKATKDDDGKQTPPTKAILIFSQSKSEILSLITAVNVAAEMYMLPPRDYPFLLSKIDSYINWAMSELDTQLKQSQFETNENTVITNAHLRENNDFLKTIFKWTILLTICGIFISAWSLYYTKEANEREQRKENREVKQPASDSPKNLINS